MCLLWINKILSSNTEEDQYMERSYSTRVKMRKEPLVWDDEGAKTAKKHSKDMAERLGLGVYLGGEYYVYSSVIFFTP